MSGTRVWHAAHVITDLLSAQATSDPHTVFRALRAHGPVVWLPEHRAWFVSTYDGVHAGFRDPRLSSDRLTPLESRLDDERRALLARTFDLLRGWMVFHDPPAHARLRDPVRSAFTPRAVQSLRPFVERVVDDAIDRMVAGLRRDGVVDVARDLARPLPAIVIAEILGVPHDDRDEFTTWSNQLAALVFGGSGGVTQARTAAAGAARFEAYFSSLIDGARPVDGHGLLDELVAAARAADPPFTAIELVGACTLLLFGGHETTTGLIVTATAALLTDLDAWSWLTANLDRTADAVEELHRFDGPTKVMVRVVAEDHELHGTTLERGQTVFLGVASANRDPSRYHEPDRLVLDRADPAPHLGFGHGLHHCLGAPLARMEVQVALARAAERLPEIRLAVEPADLAWSATVLGRGLGSLPVRLAGGRMR
jgi:cytochrome P450